MARPNILYIHSHDTGRYVQPYGYNIPTPNIQQLAQQGALFRQAFCAGPTCSPSRAGLLTGQCAHSSGMLGLAHRGFKLHDHRQLLVHTLKQAGYASALFGIQHVTTAPHTLGYDHVGDCGGRVHQAAPAAVDWLNRKPAQPFFLDVGFFETHRPLPPAMPADDARWLRPPAPLPDTPATRADMAAFCSSARTLDQGVGQVLAALEANGLAENTLVLCTTDHGIAFPAMKCNLTDHGTGVMLILRGPGGWTGGKVIDAMVSHIDVFPTLCEYLGLDKPAWLQGRSMMPLIAATASEINEEIFSEVTFHAAYEPMRMVRTQRYKYIRRYNDRPTAVLPNCDSAPSKDCWMQQGWKDRPMYQGEELYDLAFDPNEAHNLAPDPRHAPVLKEMAGRLDAWMQRTDDPLRAGFVPPPPGSMVNDVNGVDPHEPTIQH